MAEYRTGPKFGHPTFNCNFNTCPEQGQNPNSQLSSPIFAPNLPTEPEDHDQTIHRVPVNGLIVILRFYEY